jgi:hypothetical protein
MSPANSRGAVCVRAALLLILVSTALRAQDGAPPTPAQLNPPKGARLVLHAIGKGDQVYTCKLEGSQYSWTFKEPRAELFDEKGKHIGRHFAGPSWQLEDESRVTGKVIAHTNSPDGDGIPWLLLAAVDHSGAGLMGSVTDIQRLNTRGGKAPGHGCDAQHVGEESRVAYSADYLFFSR